MSSNIEAFTWVANIVSQDMNTIPNEILTEIFRTLTVVDRPFSRPPGPAGADGADWYHSLGDRRTAAYIFGRSQRRWVDEGNPALGWVNITYVCHKWRESALQTSSLWTYLPDAVVLGSRWLGRFIERGREAGVHYDDKDLIALGIEGHELLSEHIHHIGILRLMNYKGGADRYHGVLQRPMPLVTELSLQNLDLTDIRLIDLPRLRKLRLWNNTVRISWPTQLCSPNITSFDYYAGKSTGMTASNATTLVDMSTVFVALQEMPRLSSLTLRLEAVQPVSTQSLPQAELRSLTRMDISGDSGILHPVLRRITFPPSASLRIAPLRIVPGPIASLHTTPYTPGSDDERSNLIFVDFYEELIHQSGLPPFCTVEVTTKMNTLYVAAARHRLPDVSFAKPSYDLQLELPAIQNTNMHSLAAKILGRLFENDNIRELYVSGAWNKASIAMFYEMSQIVHLDIMGPAVTLLVGYITGKVQPRSSPEEKRLGEHVETLALHRGHLDDDECRRLVENLAPFSAAFGSEGRLRNVYLSKTNLSSLLRDLWFDPTALALIGV